MSLHPVLGEDLGLIRVLEGEAGHQRNLDISQKTSTTTSRWYKKQNQQPNVHKNAYNRNTRKSAKPKHSTSLGRAHF